MTEEMMPITALAVGHVGTEIEIHTDEGSVVSGRLENLEVEAHIDTFPNYQDANLRTSVHRTITLQVGGFTFKDNGSAEWRRKDRP